MKPPATWQTVQEAVRSRGAEDLARAIAEMPPGELDRAWQRKRRPWRVSRTKEGRRSFIDRAVRRWSEGNVSTEWAACAIKWALSLPPAAPGPASRPAFPVGNQLAVIHGARSERAIAERLPEAVERVKAALEEEVGTTHPSDQVRLREVARTLTRIDLLDAYLDQEGDILDGNGRPLPSMGLRLSLANLLERQMTGLGLGPMARARLKADQAAGAVNALEAQKRLRREYGSA